MKCQLFWLHWALIQLSSSVPVKRSAEDPAVRSARQLVDSANDAVVVQASDDSGSIVSPDGPGPSILGSLDNIFGSVKDFDQYRCLEKMLCEYMQEDGDAVSELIGRPLAGFQNPASTVQDNRFTPNSNFGPQTGSRPQPASLASTGGGGLLSSLGGLLLGRKKRQTSNTQGNIIRLFQATGMDHMNMFPYVRAALIGHATRNDVKSAGGGSFNRRGNSCAQMYRECPTQPDRIVDYLNNHNGGLFNQVEPSVNNEVGPLVSSIVSDAIGLNSNSPSNSGGSLASGAAGSDSSFSTIDKLISTALINNAAGMLTGSSGSSASSATSGGGSAGGGALSGLSSLVGGGGGGALSGLSSLVGGGGGGALSGLSSLVGGQSGVLNQAFNTFSSFVSGRKK